MMFRALVFALFASPAFAQSAADVAERAATSLREASTALELAQTKADRVGALTETVQAYETGLVAMRDGLRQAAIREQTLIAQLDAKSVEVSRLLGVLQSIERAPAPLMLLHPDGPLDTVRGGMMTADVTPALQTEVEALRVQLSEVAILRTLQDRSVATLQDGLNGAQAAREALSKAIADRTDLPRRFVADQAQMQLLLTSTRTLDDFAVGLRSSGAVVADTPLQVAGKGDLPLPVLGQLLRRAGAPDAAGIVRPGVILSAPARALVTAPAASTVLFAGPLLDFGNVVVLEPAVDKMFVIGGLGDIYVSAGEVLGAGAPLGLLPGDTPKVDDFLTSDGQVNTSNTSQTLYLEVRDGQTPVNPADWFALE